MEVSDFLKSLCQPNVKSVTIKRNIYPKLLCAMKIEVIAREFVRCTTTRIDHSYKLPEALMLRKIAKKESFDFIGPYGIINVRFV